MKGRTLFLFSEEPVGENEKRIIQYHEPGSGPRKAAEFDIGKRPEYRRGIKAVCVSRDINENMKEPSSQFPHGTFEYHPDKEKDYGKNHYAMAYVIERCGDPENRKLVFGRRFSFFRTGKFREMKTSRNKTPKHPYEGNSKCEKVRRQTPPHRYWHTEFPFGKPLVQCPICGGSPESV